MVLGTPFTPNPLNFTFFTKFNEIQRNLVQFTEIDWFLTRFRYFCVFWWSGWSRAPQKHQYSYRNINLFSMGPPGTLQVAQKVMLTRNLLKLPKFSIILIKYWNFTKFSGILLISRFWWSHGSEPSISPRKNKGFVKGRGFVENSDFLIFSVTSLNLVIFCKNHWNP